MSRSRVSKILIVAPKLLGPQWKEELESKFDIPTEIAIGKELITSGRDGVGAIITTYNTARLYLDALPEDRFQMLILDDAQAPKPLRNRENPRGRKTLPQGFGRPPVPLRIDADRDTDSEPLMGSLFSCRFAQRCARSPQPVRHRREFYSPLYR
jgi:hypothetical protein